MDEKKPEDFKCDVSSMDDGRQNLADMAHSLDNMSRLMTQLHATQGRRGVAVSWVAEPNGRMRTFITATNDIDEENLGRIVVATFQNLLFDVSRIADERRAYAEIVEAVRLFRDSGFHGGESIIAALAKLDAVDKVEPTHD